MLGVLLELLIIFYQFIPLEKVYVFLGLLFFPAFFPLLLVLFVLGALSLRQLQNLTDGVIAIHVEIWERGVFRKHSLDLRALVVFFSEHVIVIF